MGTGQPVMLVHGFGEDGNIWNGLVEYLEGFKWIIPDIPGSGQSEMLDGENISIEDYADVIKAILDLELSKVSPPVGGGEPVPSFRDLEVTSRLRR